MALKAECSWARVCIRETKALCSGMKKSLNEGREKFGARALTEKHKLYSAHFKEYLQFALSQFQLCVQGNQRKDHQLEEQRRQEYLLVDIFSGYQKRGAGRPDR